MSASIKLLPVVGFYILFYSTTTETSSHKSRTVGIGSEDIYKVSLKKKQKHTIFRCNSTAKAMVVVFFQIQ